MRRIATLFIMLAFPLELFAAVPGISRQDGFLQIWGGINRPAEETREKSFSDVGENDKGFLEITYAKSRGILDDGEKFYPADPLLLSDAVQWLLRTRNIDDLDQLTPENLPEYLKKYPIADLADLRSPVPSGEKLSALVRALDEMLAKEVHELSLYSEKFHGKGTAFGEVFDMNALTAAHRTYPANTLVKVTNVDNGKSVIVRINDRGPYVDGRDMDLSLAAFLNIAPRSQGVARATFERLGDQSLVGACGSSPKIYQKRIAGRVLLNQGIPRNNPLGDAITLSSTRTFVVRSILYPDGTVERIENWILPGEIFTLNPSLPGAYAFRLSTMDGHHREVLTDVWQCANPGGSQ